MINCILVLLTFIFSCNLLVTSDDQVFLKNSTTVIVLDHTNFKKTIDSGGTWFVDFYAPWCQHCKQISPILDEVAISLKDYPNLFIGKFDSTTVNENKKLSSEYDVQAYPSFLYFKNGIYGKYQGGRNKDDILQFMLKLNESTHQIIHKQTELEEILESKKYAFVLSIPGFTTSSSGLSEEMASALTNEWITLFEQLSNHWHLKSYFILYFYNNKNKEINEMNDKNKINNNHHHHHHNIFFSRMEHNKEPVDFTLPSSSSINSKLNPTLNHLKPPNYEMLETFFHTHNHPFLISVDNQNANFLGNLNKTLLLLVLDVKSETAASNNNSNNNSGLLNEYENACYTWYINQQQQDRKRISNDQKTDAAINQQNNNNNNNNNDNDNNNQLQQEQQQQQQRQQYTYEDVLFGYMDGIKYKNYLTRYDIKSSSSSSLPALILLNLTHDLYYTLSLTSSSTLLQPKPHHHQQQHIKETKTKISSDIRTTINDIVHEVLNQYLYMDFHNLLDQQKPTPTINNNNNNNYKMNNSISVKMKLSKKLTVMDKLKKKFSDTYPWSYIICSIPILLFIVSFLLPKPSDSKVKQH